MSTVTFEPQSLLTLVAEVSGLSKRPKLTISDANSIIFLYETHF